MSFLTKLFGPVVETIHPSQVQEKLKSAKRPLVLDVREDYETRSGMIPGAKLIPLGELRKRMEELPKEKEIICVCQTGSRSTSASRQLAKAGYNVLNMRGGMALWIRTGLPTKKGK